MQANIGTPIGPGFFIFFQDYQRIGIANGGIFFDDDEDDVALIFSLISDTNPL